MAWGRRSRRYDSDSHWPRYVTVAERRIKAEKEMQKLQKKGKELQPVVLDTQKIAHSFWGKAWCHHLESFSDYSNRLPRGRSYVRNGSVCHLEIRPGVIEAHVSGSSLYTVTIRVKPLPAASWTALKEKCSGQIGSMLELLQGKFSDKVMAIVADRKTGLFPQPGEMDLSCSCPDWAKMCKHVAAVLYGIGSRLDTRPELLFLLREVNAEELLFANVALPAAAMHADVLASDNLGAIFGIDLEPESEPTAASRAPEDSVAASPRTPRAKPEPQPKRRSGPKPVGKAKAKASPERKGAKAAASPPAVTKRGKTPTPAAAQTATVGAGSQPKELTREPRMPAPAPKKPSPRPQRVFRAEGPFIRALRVRLKLTAERFASQIGVTPATVRRWEATAGPLRIQSRPLKALREIGDEPSS